ncbi:Leaf-specific thionin [Thalictrum thalictroides]|uniref:Leaf-specific thionin n=1 Tax=Thalictrum thalictroides TaxID=46969 RepID=A0A7J6UV32_THATH|nr:Leaf-specific thionin [Thalictrum thalictroides]
MEGKGVRVVIMGLLILGLVVAQIEAKSCCRNTTGRNCYNVCRLPGTPRPICEAGCDCINISGNRCPSTHPRSSMLENSDDEVIEQVTTDLEASRPVICQGLINQNCFNMCRAAPIICAQRCGCVIAGLDRN